MTRVTTSENEFISFDGGVKCAGRLLAPEDLSELTLAQAEIEAADRALIPRGAGLSFAAASFGDKITSVDMTSMNKIEVLNATESTISVEAGISVGDLLEYLLSKGFYFPVMPGYPTITVGGCMAADAHGKNQIKDGTFVAHVERFRLHHVDHGFLDVSSMSNKDAFDLTMGGFGLTGTILGVTLKISKLPSRFMNVVTEPITDIAVLPEMLADRSRKSEFIISWHDFVQAGGRFGNGFLQWGNFAGQLPHEPMKLYADSSDDSVQSANLTIHPIRREQNTFHSPLTLTSDNRGFILPQLFGLMTTGLMNAVYNYGQRLTCGPPRKLPVELCFFPSKILRDLYFHFFGRCGFFEHQIIVPSRNFGEYIEKVHWWLSHNELPITIASAKMFEGEKYLLRFNDTGVCFAMDFPRCHAGRKFLTFLDQLTIEIGGLPNIVKDSRLPREVVEATYPDYQKFRTMLRDYDPKRRYQSELSRRLDL